MVFGEGDAAPLELELEPIPREVILTPLLLDVKDSVFTVPEGATVVLPEEVRLPPPLLAVEEPVLTAPEGATVVPPGAAMPAVPRGW